MKALVLSIHILLFPFLGIGQQYYNLLIIDKSTNQPIKGIRCTILKNHDRHVNSGISDENGLVEFYIKELDSTATYHVEILNRFKNFVKSARHEISFIGKEIPVVKVERTEKEFPYSCSEITFFRYHPKEPYSIEELPDNIRRKVKSYLINKVGERFYERIRLNGGQIIDLEKYFEYNPELRASKTKPYSYILCFMVLSDDYKILYSFNVALDRQGNLLEQISIPDIKQNPEKAILITKEEAVEIAKNNNFYSDSTASAYTYYTPTQYFDPNRNSIVWQFEKSKWESKGIMIKESLFIDAHNGAAFDEKRTRISGIIID